MRGEREKLFFGCEAQAVGKKLRSRERKVLNSSLERGRGRKEEFQRRFLIPKILRGQNIVEGNLANMRRSQKAINFRIKVKNKEREGRELCSELASNFSYLYNSATIFLEEITFI